MKTKLLRKLRRKAQKKYKIVFSDGKYYIVLLRWPDIWLKAKSDGHYTKDVDFALTINNLDEAKQLVISIRRRYIKSRLREMRESKINAQVKKF
jgi:hypothetical protein